MKKVYSSLVGLLVCFFPVYALAYAGQSIEMVNIDKSSLGPAAMTVGEVMSQWKKLPPAESSRTAYNITDEGPSSAVLIMGAANSPGAFGSYFTTDLYAVNPHATGQPTITVTVFAVLNGVDYSVNNPPSGSFKLQPRQCAILKNIGQMLGVSGGFTLLMGASTSSFSAWSYTSTPGQVGGRYGVNIHGVGGNYQDWLYDGWNVGAEVSGAARTNFAIFNLNSTSLTINVSVYSSAGGSPVATIPVVVPPYGCVQKSLATYVPSLSDGTLWFVYGSGGGSSADYVSYMVVNDNVTNDANFQLSTGW